MAAYEAIEFESDGATLRGRLYLPSGAEPPFAAVVMAHGLSATLTMCADRYAEVFAARGIAALLYDHRNFGISDGEPRQAINAWQQARGYRSALDFLSGHPKVDPARLAVWGDSYTGGIVLLVAACDDRVRAVVAQCPATGAAMPPEDSRGDRFETIRQTLLTGDIRGTPETTVGPMPVVSPDQAGTPSLLKPISAFRWFLEYGGRHGSGWLNTATRVSPPVPEPFHAGLCAPHVHVPVLALISPDDEIAGANPAVAHAVFASVAGPTEVEPIEGGHFGLLFYPSPEFEFASQRQAAFLLEHL
jgi:pimeloyl-ACP methyl ester carboxylesterase